MPDHPYRWPFGPPALLLFLVALTVVTTPSFAQPTGFQHEIVTGGMTEPVTMAILPDDRMIIAQKGGILRITSPLHQPPVTTTFYMIMYNVDNSAEHGISDIVLDPDFSNNGYFYLYYAHTSTRNRISRFVHNGNTASAASEVVIWQSPEMYTQCCHIGGGLAFANDGTLFFSTGDDFQPNLSQDLGYTHGKIHRINSDGTIPVDNPFHDATPGMFNANGKLKSIHSYGLRNPFRINYDPVLDELLIGQVGGNDQLIAWEDIHRASTGANYGWPYCGDVGRTGAGACSDPQYNDPVMAYPHAGQGAAVADGPTYRGTMFPPQWYGRHFYADYIRGYINYLEFDALGNVVASGPFVDHTQLGPAKAEFVVKMLVGPDGALYYLGLLDDFQNGFGRLHRITYAQNMNPVCSAATATPDSGSVLPFTVQFNGAATDPENEPLTYIWVFGDGTPNDTGATVYHDYTAYGSFNAQLLVSDGVNTVSCATVPVVIGQPPVVQILSPADGTTFRAGDVITFEGASSDDGPLSLSDHVWTVLFNHNEHTHPEAGATGSLTYELIVPTQGHGFSDSTWYTVSLKVTDQDGLIAMDQVRVYPEKVDVVLQSDPPGLVVLLNGLPVVTPYTTDQAIGGQFVVSLPNTQQCDNGDGYVFQSWSNGLPFTHVYTVPASDDTLTVNMVSIGDCQNCGQALSFDGIQDRVMLPELTLSGDHTVEFWVRAPANANSDDVIMSNGVDQWIDLAGGRFRYWRNGLALVGSQVLPANQWTHVAMVRTGTTLRLFLNGVEDLGALSFTSTGGFEVDRFGMFDSLRLFNGALDEVRLWSVARTDAQILANYDISVAPDAVGLFAYWNMDLPGDAQVLDDLGANGYNGHLGTDVSVEASDPVFFSANGPMKFVCPRNVDLSLRAFLSGPYDEVSGLMFDSLRRKGYLPSLEPYTEMGFDLGDHTGLGVSPGVLQVAGSNAIVDWVLVELRDPNAASTVLHRIPALLQRDGDIVALDGVSALPVTAVRPRYSIAVRHRNHLGAMTLLPRSFQGAQVALDMSLPSTQCFGTEAREDRNGILTLWAGNAKLDGVLKYSGVSNDRDVMLVVIGATIPTATVDGYFLEDVNLDGTVKYVGSKNDRDLLLHSIGGWVPTETRTEQLP